MVAKQTEVSSKTPDMTIEELRAVHELYSMFKDEWDFLYAAYEGARALVRAGHLIQHERETTENYEKRKNQAFGFNYTQSIVDVLNFYLFKKSVKRTLPEKVSNDPIYKMFEEDCNLEADGMDEYLAEVSRLASIMGLTGVLVDKAGVALDSRADQIRNRVHPYLSTFFPQAILDWKIGKDEFSRPVLEMVKLLQDDGTFLIWYPDQFEIWQVPVNEKGEPLTEKEKAELVKAVTHPLGIIPFIFVINKKWKKRPIGKSDVADIARIDVSIIRNLSQGEEIIDYQAFPMMRKPFLEARPDEQVDAQDEVGPTAVLGFDPDNPDAKPDWLESEVSDPLEAIKEWIINKINEIYRTSNIGGMQSTEGSNQVESGVALQTRFQMLNATLVRKAIILEKVEKQVYNMFYLWEWPDSARNYIEETLIERDRTYDVENLSEDLENIITSKTIVKSKTFDSMLQKKTVRKLLPSYTDAQLKDIDDEIDESIEKQEEESDYNPFDELKVDEQQPNENDTEDEED